MDAEFNYRFMGEHYLARLGCIDGPDSFFVRLEYPTGKNAHRGLQVWLSCGTCRSAQARPLTPTVVKGTSEEALYSYCAGCKAPWPDVQAGLITFQEVSNDLLEQWLEASTGLTPLQLPLVIPALKAELDRAAVQLSPR